MLIMLILTQKTCIVKENQLTKIAGDYKIKRHTLRGDTQIRCSDKSLIKQTDYT